MSAGSGFVWVSNVRDKEVEEETVAKHGSNDPEHGGDGHCLQEQVADNGTRC